LCGFLDRWWKREAQAKEKEQLNTEDYTKEMMESSMGIDMGLLDLLQLPDLPSSPSPSSSSTSPKHSLSHARLDDLFAQWLSLPDTQRLVELTVPPPSVSVSLCPLSPSLVLASRRWRVGLVFDLSLGLKGSP
jgi:hypothetical protein